MTLLRQGFGPSLFGYDATGIVQDEIRINFVLYCTLVNIADQILIEKLRSGGINKCRGEFICYTFSSNYSICSDNFAARMS